MAKASKFAPFPPMVWDGFDWSAESVALPWTSSAEPIGLMVRSDRAVVKTELPAKSAPPSSAQIAAFRYLADSKAPVRKALLPVFHQHVPEVQGADWEALEAVFALGTVIVFATATGDVAYVGLDWHCLQWDLGYEHGVGLLMHRDRVVHCGMAGDAISEQQAQRDARKRREGPPGRRDAKR